MAAETVAAETVAAKTLPEKAKAAEPPATDAEPLDAASPDPEPDADLEPDAEHHPLTTDDTTATAIVTADSAVEPAETAHEDAGEDKSTAAPATGAKLVTVIPGVPRYHDPDCILIRFMDDDDIARKSIPEAKAANCTPCAACQPEG